MYLQKSLLQTDKKMDFLMAEKAVLYDSLAKKNQLAFAFP
jgi:hypothetical protein